MMLVVVFFAGAAAMRLWDVLQKNRRPVAEVQPVETESVLLLDLKNAQAPQDVSEVDSEGETKEITVPSQLTKLELSGVEKIISRSGAEFAPQESTDNAGKEPINVGTDSYPPAPTASAETAPASKISLIEAPVQPLLITSTEEYRTFKRRARGSYPEADFATQQVLVLESTSNLPDKVFEIDSVREEDGKLIVRYRVNVFGLDKKTNTHAAVVISKRDLPLELKQII